MQTLINISIHHRYNFVDPCAAFTQLFHDLAITDMPVGTHGPHKTLRLVNRRAMGRIIARIMTFQEDVQTL